VSVSVWKRIAGALSLAALYTVAPSARADAQESASEAATVAGVEIAILEPKADAPVFGETMARVGVFPPDAAIDRVEFYLDDTFMGSDEDFPYEFPIDFGQQNTGHELLVVVRGSDGWTIERRVSTPAIATQDEVKVRLQQLYVTIERDGEPVKDLDRSDFEVRDGGARQQLVTFERGDVPFTAILLVDASVSMRGEALEKAIRGARTFASSMYPLDEAMLILFSDRTVYETPFTGFSSVLSLGLGAAEAAGYTALNDYLYIALKRLEERQGRRVIILLSDGFDVNSVLDIEAVREVARVNPTVIHWVFLRDPEDTFANKRSFWRSLAEQTNELKVLEETVLESGGSITPIDHVDQVVEAFQNILSELRDQFVLGYYPPPGSVVGEWREVDVRVDAASVDVRTRKGYYVPPDQ